jgi:hypothetical protein
MESRWSITQPRRRMKLCHLQENGWNPLSEISQTKKTDIICFLSYVATQKRHEHKGGLFVGEGLGGW